MREILHVNEMIELGSEEQVVEPIYVVGFPKSGNTWLTRLLADVLQATVSPSDIRGRGVEIASEINRRLSPPAGMTFELSKVHLLSTLVFQEVDQLPKRIVYIYRDFRDIVVSAFFYQNRCEEADVCMKSFASLLFKPCALFRYWCCRRRLSKYVEKLSIDGWGKEVGTWSQHVAEWRSVSTQRSDIKFVFVSYEELLNDTPSTILRIIHKLRLPEPSDKSLQNTVKRHSFAAVKEYFQKLPDDADIPLGKDFNVRFLRKGVSGDWKNFLSPRMERIIYKHHEEELIQLGYEIDSARYKKIEPNAP